MAYSVKGHTLFNICLAFRTFSPIYKIPMNLTIFANLFKNIIILVQIPRFDPLHELILDDSLLDKLCDFNLPFIFIFY